MNWLANATADADVVAELKSLDDAKIEDAFYRDLAFWYGWSARRHWRWHQPHERIHGGKGLSGVRLTI